MLDVIKLSSTETRAQECMEVLLDSKVETSHIFISLLMFCRSGNVVEGNPGTTSGDETVTLRDFTYDCAFNRKTHVDRGSSLGLTIYFSKMYMSN